MGVTDKVWGALASMIKLEDKDSAFSAPLR